MECQTSTCQQSLGQNPVCLLHVPQTDLCNLVRLLQVPHIDLLVLPCLFVACATHVLGHLVCMLHISHALVCKFHVPYTDLYDRVCLLHMPHVLGHLVCWLHVSHTLVCKLHVPYRLVQPCLLVAHAIVQPSLFLARTTNTCTHAIEFVQPRLNRASATHSDKTGGAGAGRGVWGRQARGLIAAATSTSASSLFCCCCSK